MHQSVAGPRNPNHVKTGFSPLSSLPYIQTWNLNYAINDSTESFTFAQKDLIETSDFEDILNYLPNHTQPLDLVREQQNEVIPKLI